MNEETWLRSLCKWGEGYCRKGCAECQLILADWHHLFSKGAKDENLRCGNCEFPFCAKCGDYMCFDVSASDRCACYDKTPDSPPGKITRTLFIGDWMFWCDRRMAPIGPESEVYELQ